jgi:hypothetical protein
VYCDDSRCLQSSMNAETAISEKMAKAAPDTNMAIEPVLLVFLIAPLGS